MEVVDIEDLEHVDHEVICRFCGEETIVRVSYIEVDDFVQTISKVRICCEQAAQYVDAHTGEVFVPRN